MNDIITDFIGKQIAKRLEQNRPIEKANNVINNSLWKRTEKELKHIQKCKKQICTECSKILRGDNN